MCVYLAQGHQIQIHTRLRTPSTLKYENIWAEFLKTVDNYVHSVDKGHKLGKFQDAKSIKDERHL